jgi:membrane protease YdiL (CAAX protease family)
MRQYLDKPQAVILAFFPSLTLGLLNTFYTEFLYQKGALWFWLADITQWIVVPFFCWFLVLRPNRITFPEIGFHTIYFKPRPPQSTDWIKFILTTVVLGIAYFPVASVLTRWLGNYANFGYGSVAAEASKLQIVSVLYFSITAAVIEEVVFRGLPGLYFAARFTGKSSRYVYVLVTTILFAATHSELGPSGVVAALTYGIAAAVLFLKLRNLWPIIFAHFVIDVYSFWPK